MSHVGTLRRSGCLTKMEMIILPNLLNAIPGILTQVKASSIGHTETRSLFELAFYLSSANFFAKKDKKASGGCHRF